MKIKILSTYKIIIFSLLILVNNLSISPVAQALSDDEGLPICWFTAEGCSYYFNGGFVDMSADILEECYREQLSTAGWRGREKIYADVVGAVEANDGRIRRVITDFSSGHDVLPLKIERVYLSGSESNSGEWRSNFTYGLLYLDHIPIEPGVNEDPCGDELYRPVIFQRGVYGTDSLHVEMLKDGTLEWRRYNGRYKAKIDISRQSDGSFIYVNHEESRVEYYGQSGRISKIVDDTTQITLAWTYYSDGRIRITRTGGSYIEFAETSNIIKTSAGHSFKYTASSGRITKVEYPSGKLITYEYDSNHKLIKETHNGELFSEWKYRDGLISEQKIGHLDATKFTYEKLSSVSDRIQENKVTVTQAGGRKTEFYTEDGDVVKIIGKEGGLPTSTTTREYLAHRLTSETNNRGIKRTFEYNDWGWQIVSREAAGTADEIYVNTQWATVRKIPNSVETPSTLTTYTYYSETRPLVTKKTIKDKVSGIIRTWSYSYQFHSNGMISRIGVDGPRLDVSDIAYEYYDTSGRLIKEVNALGHTTEYLAFDALSRPNQIKYADDSIKTVVYDGRGRINKETVSNEKGTQVTLYEYDVEGNIIKTTDPSGKIWVKNYDRGYALESEGVGGNYEENALRTNYEYDKLGKLSVIEKGRIAAREGAEVGEEDCEIRDFEEINCYTFTEEDVYYFLRSYSKDFINDNLGHLIEDIYADGNKTLHYYDELSRLSKVTSPSGSNLISYQYDSLDRVKMKTDAVGRITTYTYDKDSNVVSIKDNANRFFDFSYNAFGEIKSLKMPHAGTTINTYDEASNLLTTTFQDGNFITNKYDAANRLIERKLSTGETHYFTYDRFTTEKGLLGKIADASGSTEYRYDNKFRKVSSVVYSIDGQNFSMSYTYDEAGNIASITYPSGYRITYDRNAITGEVTAIQGNNNNLLYNIKYKPLGDIETYQYGTNRTVELKYDRNYKITDINAGPMDLAFTYNSDQLVSQKTNNAYSAETQTFTYFKDQSLKEENGTNKKSQYTYDKIQNRLSETTISGNGLNGNYNYDSNEMLVGINGDGSIEYDARGNVIYDEHHGSRSERAYNALNQLTHVTLTSLNEPRNRPDYHSDCEPSEENCNNNTMILVLPLDIIYVVPIPLEGNATTSGSTSTETDVLEGDATRMLYNAHGHRTLKISPSGTYRFIYDQSGRLLAESLNGNLTKEYIYLGERLVAIKRGSTIDYVITDHTLRPEVVVNSSGSIVWRAFNHAFSREVVADSIDGLNIGFPGQYYDEEIDTWYNIRRDYDAITGRYLQSDPLGTVDGPNTYIYTGNNPVNRVDPTGEFWVVFSAAVTAIDLGVQLYKNGGDLSKVNWTEAAISAVGGGIIGKVATRAGKIVQKAYRANRTKGSPANNEIAQDKVTGGSCCFVAGTEVLTESGYKNIEDVALGEKLWAKDVETGEQDWKPVTHIFVEPDRGIYTINLIGNERFEQKIQATDDHPFYVIGKGWKTTIELVVGDNIETDGHGPMVVTSVIDEKRQDLTYNFTVADFHTYYVTQRNVLVHNCGDSVTKSANPKVKEVLDSIDANGFKVKINPKNPATKQEVNATIDFGDKTKVNLRVETHPLKQNGPDVRHANVEVTRQVKNKNRVTRNDHIVDE